METLGGTTGQRAYPEIVKHVIKTGEPREPRGMQTIDAGFTVIELETPFRSLPLGCGRELNRNVAAAEAIQLIGGFASSDLITKAVATMITYAEVDGSFHGAYGKRISFQMINVETKLRKDHNTRQAVVTLWDPWLDNQPNKKDYPCTVMLQFETNSDSRLCMNVVMRSNDVWLGLPYDIFQFTQLQISLANALGLLCGPYRHTTLSLHLYAKDLVAAHRLHDPTDFTDQPCGIGLHGVQDFTDIMKRARQLSARSTPADETASERWYRERFASYLG